MRLMWWGSRCALYSGSVVFQRWSGTDVLTMKQTVIKNPTWWRRRTGMERCMTVLAGVAWCLVAALVVALVTFIISSKKSACNLKQNGDINAAKLTYNNMSREMFYIARIALP
ncbi:hypothetical protein L9F63_010345, partial [Diploptera punctata]